MRCFIMFVTEVCVFLLKLKWPKNKSFYDLVRPNFSTGNIDPSGKCAYCLKFLTAILDIYPS